MTRYLSSKAADDLYQRASERAHDLEFVHEEREETIDGLIDLLQRSHSASVFEWFLLAHREILREWVRTDDGGGEHDPPTCERCEKWAIGTLDGENLCRAHFVEVRDAAG